MTIPEMLAAMESLRASDLFVCEGKPPAVRIHGTIRALEQPATSADLIDKFLDQALTDARRTEFRDSGDLDMGYSLESGRRFRINLARQRGSTSLVARFLPSGELKLDELGLPPAVARFADLARGLVLLTGATGSGKSTTGAALLHHINSTRSVHVVTIEEPIEFVHHDIRARISQREVGADTASFHSALRHVVRESPDVIFIGEMRDLESIQVALAASLSGHLVLTTLHTVDATQTLQRILTYFPEQMRAEAAMDLAVALQGVVSQRLLPRADGQGRVLAIEVLTMSPGATRLIREQRADELVDLMNASTDPDTITFNRSLLQPYEKKLITFETGRAYASNPDQFALMARGMTTGVDGFRADKGSYASTSLDLKALLAVAIEKGASDLHLATGRPPIIRIDGALQALPLPALSTTDMRILLYSILSTRQRSQYELEREIDFALALDDGQRFRINAYHQRGQMAAALRAIPSKVPDIESLGLPTQLLTLIDNPHGLLLVAGPTGSGKTTSLACLVDRINRSRPCRIITIEDPIEYNHVNIMATVDQREIGDDTKTFARALRYILRQDPDVVLIGEMRDMETMSSAMTAAETGHLVMATLHTNDAVQTIDRVVDVFPSHQQQQARSMLSSVLLGVISQRLLPHRDGTGRVAVFEIMVANSGIRALIRDNKMHQAVGLMEASMQDGNITLDRALVDAHVKGKITLEEALRYAKNTKLFQSPPPPM